MFIFVRGFFNGLMVFFYILKVFNFVYEKEFYVNIKEVLNKLEIVVCLVFYIKF